MVADVEGVVGVPLGGRLEDGIGLVSPGLGVRVRLGAGSLLIDDELGHDAISKETEPARRHLARQPQSRPLPFLRGSTVLTTQSLILTLLLFSWSVRGFKKRKLVPMASALFLPQDLVMRAGDPPPSLAEGLRARRTLENRLRNLVTLSSATAQSHAPPFRKVRRTAIDARKTGAVSRAHIELGTRLNSWPLCRTRDVLGAVLSHAVCRVLSCSAFAGRAPF